MTGPADIALLVESLDRQVKRLVDADDQYCLSLLPRFVQFLEEEPRLNGALASLRHDAERLQRVFQRECRAARARLKPIWSDFRTRNEKPLQQLGDLEKIGSFNTRREVEDALEADEPFSILDDDPDECLETRSAKMIGALMHYHKCLTDRGFRNDPEHFADSLYIASVQVSRAETWLRVQGRTHGWVVFQRLTRWVGEHLPPPLAYEQCDVSGFAKMMCANDTSAMLEEKGRELEVINTREVVNSKQRAGEIRRDAPELREELRGILLGQASRLVVLRRYAARCSSFDAHHLRKMCNEKAKAGRGKAEARLTLHAARYFFDQGLNPIIDGTVGAHRPDLLDAAVPRGLYVEAKQYQANDKAPRSLIIKAARQTWNTWARLRMNYSLPEAFLLVFRRGGKPIEPPFLSVTHAGFTLHFVLVDIAEASGSRERFKPVSIAESDLLPEGVSS